MQMNCVLLVLSYLSSFATATEAGVECSAGSCETDQLLGIDQEEDAGLELLQLSAGSRQKLKPHLLGQGFTEMPEEQVHRGCDPSDAYGMHQFSDADKAGDEKGVNPWQTSFCNRTKRTLDDLNRLLLIQTDSPCFWETKPKKILSFGCSIGIEAEELKGRWPDAEISGYDISSDVIAKAKNRTKPNLNIKFTDKAEELPHESFDLITVNNVLFTKMAEDKFREFFQQLLNLLNPNGGTLELMIWDTDLLGRCDAGQCKKFGFDSKMAWKVIRESFPKEVDYFPERTCKVATFPSVWSTLFVYKKSPESKDLMK